MNESEKRCCHCGEQAPRGDLISQGYPDAAKYYHASCALELLRETQQELELADQTNELHKKTIALQEIKIERMLQQLDDYRKWVDDLQSGMYVNCVYCGHRYGPADEVPGSMAEALRQHIEACPKHPMSKLKMDFEEACKELEKLREERSRRLGWRE